MKLIYIYLLLSTLHIFSQEYNLDWAKSISGGSNVQIRENVIDSDNNIYVTGNFIGSVDFDPSSNNYILTSPTSTNNNNNDIFIAKYNVDGNLVWAKQLIGSGIADYGLSIDLDSNGNIYTTGYFSQNVDFNPSPSGYNSINVNGFPHAYLLKLDNNGNYIWAKHIVSSASSIARKVKIHNNNIFLTGSFYGNSDFDFSSNIYQLSSNSTQEDGFIAKYNLDGDFIWAKKYGGTGVGEILQGINFDSNNNIYATGYIRASTTTGSTLIDGITSVQFFGQDDILIIKTNDLGELIWTKSFGSSNYDYSWGDVSIDNNDNIYIIGQFRNTIDFNDDPSITFNLSTYFISGFLLKLNSNGVFQNAIKIGGNGDYTPCIQSLISQNQITIFGQFSDTVDFDNSINNSVLSSSGQEDLYILNLDLNLNFLNVKKIGGNANQYFGGGSYKNGNLYITGSFNGNTNFDLIGSSNILIPVGNYDSFITKYSAPLLNHNTFTSPKSKIYPNPFYSSIDIESSNLNKVEIYDSFGKLHLFKTLTSENILNLDLSHLIKNTYYIKLTNSENHSEYFKILKE